MSSRYRFQVSLRVLFESFAVLGVMLSLLVILDAGRHSRSRACQSLRAIGIQSIISGNKWFPNQSSIAMGFANGGDLKTRLLSDPIGTKKIAYANLLKLPHPIEVHISGDLEGLAPLSMIPSTVTCLDYSVSKISQSDMLGISGFKNLERLYIDDCHIDCSLAPLSNLKNLKELVIGRSPLLSSEQIKAIGRIGSLEYLTLRHPNINDDDIDALCKLNNLRRLRLGSVNVTDAALKKLSVATANYDNNARPRCLQSARTFIREPMMYDPVVGRWLSEDPIGIEGADPNFYRYVGNADYCAAISERLTGS